MAKKKNTADDVQGLSATITVEEVKEIINAIIQFEFEEIASKANYLTSDIDDFGWLQWNEARDCIDTLFDLKSALIGDARYLNCAEDVLDMMEDAFNSHEKCYGVLAKKSVEEFVDCYYNIAKTGSNERHLEEILQRIAKIVQD